MRKQISTALLVGMILIFIGCGKSGEQAESEGMEKALEKTAAAAAGMHIMPADDKLFEEGLQAFNDWTAQQKEATEIEQTAQATEQEAGAENESGETIQAANEKQTAQENSSERKPVQSREEEPKRQEEPQAEEVVQAEQPAPEPEPVPQPATEAPQPAAPKSIYDYEFDVEAIRAELIALGESAGIPHIVYDDGVLRTPDNASWAMPVTASKNFQGDMLKRSLLDYVLSMPAAVKGTGGEVQCFTIYVEPRGDGSYTFYYLY